MRGVIKIFFFLSLLIFLTTCKDQSTNPTLQLKSPFEMTWSADTISYPGSMQTFLTSMWASSPTDVWIAGHNEVSLGEIYHFNGTLWNEINPMTDVPGSAKSINQIAGLESNNVWMVGDRSGYYRKDLIINWDGFKWKEHNLNLQIRPLRIFAVNSNDIWVGCDSAVVLHYDGIEWKRDKITLNLPEGAEYFINGIVVKNNSIYLNVTSYDTRENRYILFFLKGTIRNWSIIDSMEIKDSQSIIKWGNWGLSLGKEGGIYSFGKNGAWEYKDNSWIQIISSYYTIQNVFSLNNSYKLAVGVFGSVWFYNGSFWQLLAQLFPPNEDIVITDAWSDGKNIFILGHTTFPQRTIVWRGK